MSACVSRVFAIFLVCAAGVAVAAGPDELDDFVAAEMQRWAIPGLAVAVVKDDAVVLARGYGVRQIDRPERVDADTTFGIGSVTKSFTAAAAAMLVDDGKLAWDAPVIDYVPALHFSDPWITEHAVVRDLTSHRLGIDESAIYMVHSGTFDSTLRAVRYMRPAVPFRTFLYSNTGYALLGKTIESVSGRTWDEFIAERIFQPLGMNHSYPSEHAFIDADKIANCWLCTPPAGTPLGRDALRNPNANAAVPHGLIEPVDTAKSTDARVKVLPWRSERSVASTGLIHSSARDMAQWMTLHLAQGEYHGRRLIGVEQLKQVHAAQVLVPETDSEPVAGFRLQGYGMGWFVGTYRGLVASQHGGGRVGFGSQVWLFPEKKVGVVVLQNLDYREGPPLSMIAMRFADRYLGLSHDEDADAKARERVAAHKAMGTRLPLCSDKEDVKTDLKRYAGAYRNDMLGDAQVLLERNRLVLAFEPGSSADLHPRTQDFIACFRGHEQSPAPLTFTYDPTGAVTGFVVGPSDPQAPPSLGFKRIR